MADDVNSLGIDVVLACDQIQKPGQVTHIIDTGALQVTAGAGGIPVTLPERVEGAIGIGVDETVFLGERGKVEIGIHQVGVEGVSVEKKE